MLNRSAGVMLLLSGALSAFAGMYAEPVVHLDAKSFRTVMSTEHAAMVAFVAPWCGHCKSLGPEYSAAAQSLSPLIPFYAVDCDATPNKQLCAEQQVKGFPTIKAFPRAGKGAARDYNGERKRGGLVEYAKGLVPDRVKKLRTDDGAEVVLQKFLDEKPTLPHALLIHPSTPSIPFLWKVLGHRLSGKMHLGYIRDTTSHAVLSSLGVYDSADTSRDATRVVAWQAGEQDRARITEYDGTMKFNGLLEWLQTQLERRKAPAAEKKQKPAEADQVVEDMPKDGAEAPTQASKVDEAPDALPAEGVSEQPFVYDEGAAPPEPELEVGESEENGAMETGHVHEEL